MPRSKPAEKNARLRDVRAVLTLAAYVTPFILIGVAAKIWIKRKGVDLSDVQAEGDPTGRSGPGFFWGSGARKGGNDPVRRLPAQAARPGLWPAPVRRNRNTGARRCCSRRWSRSAWRCCSPDAGAPSAVMPARGRTQAAGSTVRRISTSGGSTLKGAVEIRFDTTIAERKLRQGQLTRVQEP